MKFEIDIDLKNGNVYRIEMFHAILYSFFVFVSKELFHASSVSSDFIEKESCIISMIPCNNAPTNYILQIV